MEIWILIGAILVLALLRQPVLVLLGVAALFVYAVWNDGRPEYALYDVWFAVNQDVLLAIPLFVLAGAVMSAGAIAERIIAFMRELTRPIPGGLALAAVLSCAGFAAISGSAAVTLLAVGGSCIAPSSSAGIPRPSPSARCALAGCWASSSRPPSRSSFTATSRRYRSRSFSGRYRPSLVLIAIFSVYAVVLNRKNREGGWRPMHIVRAFGRAGFALPVPFVILGGIYTGWFTVTEAAAVAVALAVIVEVFIHRDLSFVQLKDVAVDSAKLLGSLYPILAFAFALNVFLTAEGVPRALVAELADVISSPFEFLIAANVLLLAVGMIIDVGSATLVLAPLLQPLAESQNIHPVHFGIMMIVNLGIGYLTPPLGLNLIVAMAAFRESFWTVTKAVLPFIGLMLVALWIIAAFPQIALYFVR